MTASTGGVDFGVLDDVEEGDKLKLHFLPDALGDIAYLLETILRSGDWGGSYNRWVEFSPTANFDRDWFEGRMKGRIDQLQVVNRRRPLVDIAALDQSEKPVRFRFDTNNPESQKGWGDLVDLHELGCLEILDTPERDRDISQSPAGSFTAKFTGEDAGYKQYFLDGVLPYVTFLRS